MHKSTFTAKMITRKADSTLNKKETAASQEYYTDDYNFVGVVSFPGMNLGNRKISSISFNIVSANAGLGISHTKTVYVRKSNYQNTTQAVNGIAFVGDLLGTFTGAFYNNTVDVKLSGSLLTNLGNYFATGANTFTLYNPNPVKSSHSYSTNYLQWNSVTMTVEYSDVASTPTLSKDSVDLGTPVTINTNRMSTAATHSFSYSFCSQTGTIAENVGDSYDWTPPLSLASKIPNSTSGPCTITCTTYVGGQVTGTTTLSLTLKVPASVVPVIDSISHHDSDEYVSQALGVYLKSKSSLAVSIQASGAYGSTIASYRSTFAGIAYTGSSFTTGLLNNAGTVPLSVSVTDSRGRTATQTVDISVTDYTPPSLSAFSVERCNADGSAPQLDGDRVRVSLAGLVSPIGNQNTVRCILFYKLSTSDAWMQADEIFTPAYDLSLSDYLLSPTFDTLKSYDLKVRFSDMFYYLEQSVSVGTKQVLMDLYRDGNGIAFGKVAETSGAVEFGWPVILSSPLDIAQGGTGATTVSDALATLGAVNKTGDTMTGNLTIQNDLYPSLILKPTHGSTTKRTVFEGSYQGASSFAAYDDDNNRRMLEVRSAGYATSLDNAAMVRSCVNNSWSNYRVFHEGMETAVPIANGGTGSADAASARTALGCNNASNLSSGTLNKARLPFKFSYGKCQISGSASTKIDYTAAGFTGVPYVFACYSTTGTWTGDNGAIKVHSKTKTGASITVGGSFSTKRDIDWFAIGT